MFKLTKVFYAVNDKNEKFQLAFEVLNEDTNVRTNHTLAEILTYADSIINGEFITNITAVYSQNFQYPMLVMDDQINNVTVIPTEPNILDIESVQIVNENDYMLYYNQNLQDFSGVVSPQIPYDVVLSHNYTTPQSQPTPYTELQPTPQPQPEPQPTPQPTKEPMYSTPSESSEPTTDNNTKSEIAKTKNQVEVTATEINKVEDTKPNKEEKPQELISDKNEESSEKTDIKVENNLSSKDSAIITEKVESKSKPRQTEKEEKEKEVINIVGTNNDKFKNTKMKPCEVLYNSRERIKTTLFDIINIEDEIDENFTFISEEYELVDLMLSKIFTNGKKGESTDYLPRFIDRPYVLSNITFQVFKRILQITNVYSDGDWLEFLCKYLKVNYNNLTPSILRKAFKISFDIYAHDLSEKYNVDVNYILDLINRVINIEELTIAKFDAMMKSYNYFNVKINKNEVIEYHVLFKSDDIIFINPENNMEYSIDQILDNTEEECASCDAYQITSCLVSENKDGTYSPQGIFIKGEKQFFIPAVITDVKYISEEFKIDLQEILNIYTEYEDYDLGTYYKLQPNSNTNLVLSELTKPNQSFSELSKNIEECICSVIVNITNEEILNSYYN